MRTKILYTGFMLIIIGFLGRLYAVSYTHVTPDGVLHDSLWLPIGTFMFLIGSIMLIIVGSTQVANYLRNTLTKDQA